VYHLYFVVLHEHVGPVTKWQMRPSLPAPAFLTTHPLRRRGAKINWTEVHSFYNFACTHSIFHPFNRCTHESFDRLVSCALSKPSVVTFATIFRSLILWAGRIHLKLFLLHTSCCICSMSVQMLYL